jgi:hypothetical protein
MNLRWAIYYADGSRYGSDDGEWEDAPLDGVLFVAISDGDRTEFHSGNDHYAGIGEGDEFTIASTAEIGAILRQYAPWIKHGVWTTHANLERARKRMQQEWSS